LYWLPATHSALVCRSASCPKSIGMAAAVARNETIMKESMFSVPIRLNR